ncbi:MAG: lactonase family protein [Gemmatimonadales bacterium]
MNDPHDPSRREFLAMSAMSLIGLAGASESPALLDDAQTNGDLLYVGTYTEGVRPEGIHILRMDRRSGQLRRIRSVDVGENPSFLAIHPNRRVLYAVNELDKYNGKPTGAVSAFAITKETGALTRLNEQPSEGGAPCYVSVDQSGHVVLVANYAGGSIALLPIETNGALAAAATLDQHTGKGPNAERQQTPHAHCILADPSNRFVLSADLGVDRVYVYRLDIDGKSLHHVEGGDAVMRPGSGPRHIAFHPKLPLVFVANELDSTVATLRFDAKRGVLSPFEIHSTVPAGWTGTNYPGDIHLTSNGRTLYVSNRGHDSIAVFSVTESTGSIALEQVISTDGDWPRNFSLDPTGRWLLVANQRSGSVVVFARDPGNGRLTQTRERIAIPGSACVRFLASSEALAETGSKS